MTQGTWMLQTKKADFNRMGEKFGISPVTARLIRNRDVAGEEEVGRYLYATVKDLYDAHLMKDMDLAAGILEAKIKGGKPIRIVGDYDIDGVCSTYILYKALIRLGARVDYEIPDRIKDGYGINHSIIEAAGKEGIDTILTCDNGISAGEQIRLAKDLGMTVIITDHHEVPVEDDREALPPADAVINPKQKDCQYPFPEICGGLVAYKLVQALYELFHVPETEWLDLLEFAAIATVGDVMRLQDENRIIVKYGLKKIKDTQSLGLRKLIEKNNLDAEHLSAYHIGFVIGPCLNAGGRLQTAKLALSLLLSDNEDEAEELALKLKELNDLRKDMTVKGLEEAVVQVEDNYPDHKVLVVYLPECHESLAGIIAGRLREHFQKPSIVLTKGEEGVKGSGRSIEQYHMFKELTKVKDLLLKFGGHPMAAGLSMKEEDIEAFRQLLNVNAELKEEDFIPKIWIDLAMPLEYVSEKLVGELQLLEPFGQGNEKPQFAERNLRIRSMKVLGKNQNAVKMSLVTEKGYAMEAIMFGDGPAFVEEMGDCRKIDIIYYPAVNEYNGNRSLQITVRNYRKK